MDPNIVLPEVEYEVVGKRPIRPDGVEYEELPVVLNVQRAMERDAPLLHEGLFTLSMGHTATTPSNIASYLRYELGDVQKGFAQADVVMEREFETASVHQGYIEPHSATAFWNADGQLNIWCSTQGTFTLRDSLPEVLCHPVARIKVTPMEIGGGFGGKIPTYLEPTAALLSKKSGLPVKMVMGRTEVFEASGPAPGTWMKVKIGASKEGRLTFLTGGSRTAFATGWAAIEAAEDLKRQLIARGARIWDTPVENVQYKEGVLSHRSDPELRMTFKQLSAKLLSTGGGITDGANVDPTGEGQAFATHIVDVEVDSETGKVGIVRYTAAQDAGKAVHPSYVEGQMQGGVAQGIGWALNEKYFFNGYGQMMNPTFLDYRMPTSLDLPMIDTVIVEAANSGHPYGVRGVGEVPIVPPMAAIANAINQAVGVRLRKLPMSPTAILEALRDN